MFLDPNEPSDCNYPGVIIVATDHDEQFPNDIIFEGDPTADMEPLNEAAEALIQKIQGRWINPIESLQTTYSENILHDLQRQVAELQTNTGGKPIDIILAMKKQMDALEAEVKQLRSTQPTAPATPAEPAATSTPARRA